MALKRITPLYKGNQLLELLQMEFSFLHGARIKLVALAVIGLIGARNVQLPKIAAYFPDCKCFNSRVRRLERFLREVVLDGCALARLIVRIMNLESESRWHLVLDRTNWKFGKTDINILLLAVCGKGVGIPLFFTLLDKQGNSNQAERIDLLQRFVDTFGAKRIATITADREFIGKDWLKWLIQNEIHFVIRIKQDMKATYEGKEQPVRSLFTGKNIKLTKRLPKAALMGDVKVFLSGKWVDGDWLLIATPARDLHALERYRKRWQIETLFKAFKTQGFNLEATHITNHARLTGLLSWVFIAFAWCYRTGELKHKLDPIPEKKINQTNVRLVSFFRYGLDFLICALLSPTQPARNQDQIALLWG